MSAATSPVVHLQCGDGVQLPEGAAVASWVQAALDASADARVGEISLRLVDRAEGRQLNHTYRGRDTATNVLAFPAPQLPGLPADAEALLGDLVICAPVLHAEAAAQGKSVLSHFAHLVIHGTLHLQGLDHQDDDEARVMEALETEIMLGLGFADPYVVDPPRGAAQ